MFDISIIIISFNTKELTIKCIKSILDSKSSLKKEVIVVDNGSDDGSYEALQKLSINKGYSSLKILNNKVNLGFSKANNQAIKIASGKYILLLNSDTTIVDGAIDKLFSFAKKNKDLGVVGARLLNPDGTIQASVFRLPTIVRALKQYWMNKGPILDKYFPNEDYPTQVECLVMAAFLITPQALRIVGTLNEKYFMYYEDLDYCRKVLQSGLKIYYHPQALVYHYHGASGKKIADASNQWRRLIPSSIIYHGLIKHYIINFIIWSGLKIYKPVKVF